MKPEQLYGPDNPHPLSRMKTELVWEGKYDEYGNRRPVRLPQSPLPLQRIETIDEPRDRSKPQGLLWEEESAHRDDSRTRKDRSLRTKSELGWEYETSAKKRICVKVIDVFGVDTTTMIEVKI